MVDNKLLFFSQMAGKNLQRVRMKAKQSAITHFFSKETATNNRNSDYQIDSTKEEAPIKSIYFSPEKKQNFINPLRNFSRHSLRLKKSQGRFDFFFFFFFFFFFVS